MLTNKLTGAGAADKTYIEDVFSTYLYTGNGSTQTITNGIDLAGKGGMVWIKGRNVTGSNNFLFDSSRGWPYALVTNSTDLQNNYDTVSPTATGFTDSFGHFSSQTVASWTFRKAPKFFDVVTYTGNGAIRTISHSLGQKPGMIIIKRTDLSGDWHVYHTALGATQRMRLNVTDAAVSASSSYWNTTEPTTSEFTLGGSATVNASGGTYVAYLFAHDTTTDGLIQCGSYTTDGSGIGTVNLGWEPQYVLIKAASAASDWFMFDTMRGFAAQTTAGNGNAQRLKANAYDAEVTTGSFYLTNTGFVDNGGIIANGTIIYMAIRRGPMKTPTDGTKVFSPNAFTNGSDVKITTGFVCDAQITAKRSEVSTTNSFFNTRLIGVLAPKTTYTSPLDASSYLVSSSTGAEVSSGYGNFTRGWDNTGFAVPQTLNGVPAITWNFRRAPGFFDVVCYTGTGVARSVNHNLGVAPELMVVKGRVNAGNGWVVYEKSSVQATRFMQLNSTSARATSSTVWYNTDPTNSLFTVGTNANVNTSGNQYVAYLFASCPGVSKCGSYTGNGSSQTINCGFSAGARFVLIKRTDSTGDWYVWDTARGIVAATDPHLSLNTTAAEVTTDDTIDPDSTGFIVNQVAATNVNVNAATYIYLAIA